MPKRVLSGIQPSGDLHIGNYWGAVKNWVNFSNQPDVYDAFFCIVDYHAITVDYDPNVIGQRITDFVVVCLACGLNPDNCAVFVQSELPQHTELAWILNTVTPYSELLRMTQFKEKKTQNQANINAGLFTYPILQAADILLYDTDVVPVGEDQVQHIELTRDIAKNFNRRFGEVFKLPIPFVPKDGARIKGLDGKTKMGKSLNNHISLMESDTSLWEKLRTAFTDENRKRLSDPGNPDVCNIYALHNLYSDHPTQQTVNEQCRNAKIGCVACKKILFQNMAASLKAIQERADVIRNDPKTVQEVLASGRQKAIQIATETLSRVKKRLGLTR